MKVFNLRCDFFFFMPFFYNTPAGLKLLTIDFGYNRKSEIIVKPLTKVQSQKHLNCACKMTIAPYCNKKKYTIQKLSHATFSLCTCVS